MKHTCVVATTFTGSVFAIQSCVANMFDCFHDATVATVGAKKTKTENRMVATAASEEIAPHERSESDAAEMPPQQFAESETQNEGEVLSMGLNICSSMDCV